MLDSCGLEVLDRERCMALLTTVPVGRVVFTIRGLPAVRPVKFVLHADSVWFVAPASSALFGATDNAVVAFEADMLSADLSVGWFVTAIGHANEATESTLPSGMSELLPRGCFSSTNARYVRIPVEMISGRQMVIRGTFDSTE